jgi:hypothetical protein
MPYSATNAVREIHRFSTANCDGPQNAKREKDESKPFLAQRRANKRNRGDAELTQITYEKTLFTNTQASQIQKVSAQLEVDKTAP